MGQVRFFLPSLRETGEDERDCQEGGLATESMRGPLRTVGILSDLSDADLDALARELQWLRVLPDQEVVPHLGRSSHVYFVVEGSFRIRMATSQGRTVAFRQLSAGMHFGEIAALTGSPRTASVIAETQGLIAECPSKAFLALMRRVPDFGEKVAVSLARNIVLLTDRVFELAALEVRFRIYAELLRLARTGVESEEGVRIRPSPTHETIAAAIGAQREAVTRELRALAAEDVIHQGRREILVKDMEKLRALVQRRAGVTATQLVDWSF